MTRQLDTWCTAKAFLDHYGLVSMQLDGYNTTIEKQIPEIIESKTIEVIHDGELHKVSFFNTTYEPPIYRDADQTREVTPQKCKELGLTYASEIYVDIVYEGPDNQRNVYTHRNIGAIPVMVKSCLCNLQKYNNDHQKLIELHEDVHDQGGYFIMSGECKGIISQIKQAYNRIHIHKGKNSNDASKPKFAIYAETRSGSPNSRMTKSQVGINSKNSIIGVVLPYLDGISFHLGIVMTALGAKTPLEIIEYILPKNIIENPSEEWQKEILMLLVKTLEKTTNFTQNDALYYIGTKKPNQKSREIHENRDDHGTGQSLKIQKSKKDHISYATSLLKSDYFIHIGNTEECFAKKRAFLGLMVRKLLYTHVGKGSFANRDHFAEKRIYTSGILLGTLMFSAFKSLTSKITARIERDVRKGTFVNVSSYITSPGPITSMFTSISNNKHWGNAKGAAGISQKYDEYNVFSRLEALRKVVIPVDDPNSRLLQPRYVECSQWGITCIYKTPGDKKVGLMNGFSMGALVTVGADVEPLLEILEDVDITKFEDIETSGEFVDGSKIFVNGSPYGIVEDHVAVAAHLRKLRREGAFNPEISISADGCDIHINTESARACRGLLIVENGKLKLTQKALDKMKRCTGMSPWIYLTSNGYAEIIDKAEENTMVVAVYPDDLDKMPLHDRLKYTHCELAPDMILSIGGNTSPFSHHNQSPRNVYQSVMVTQSIGIPGANYLFSKKQLVVMDYPQKPIVATRISRYTGGDDLPMGQNAMVAICPWYGLGQEDSIVMHKNAVDRGFMCATVYTTYSLSVCAEKNQIFDIPDAKKCKESVSRGGKLQRIGKYVFAPKGTRVEKGDLLIGAVMRINNHDKIDAIKNMSIPYDQTWVGEVIAVKCGVDGKGFDNIKLTVKHRRVPIRGDKFAARHGQKGTIGALLPTEKMPYVKEHQYTPDILVNPLAFPSRMTIGMIIEAILGILMCTSAKKEGGYPDHINPKKIYDGIVGDGTPYNRDFDIKVVRRKLAEMGYDEFHDITMINPSTGEELPGLIFNGCVYYQRLKHMVVDKMHHRARGSRMVLHRQPPEGRKKNGGFKVGLMERDVILGQGNPHVILDRMCTQSDVYRAPFCNICGLLAHDNGERIECRLCSSTNCSIVELPYGTKLLQQEFMAINIVLRVICSKKPGSNLHSSTKDTRRITAPVMFIQEYAAMVAKRAKQLQRGATSTLEDMSEITRYSPRIIARKEIAAGVIPLVIIRHVFDGTTSSGTREEIWKISDFVAIFDY